MIKSQQVNKEIRENVFLSSNSEVNIQNISFKNQEVYNFLSDKENKQEWIIKALIIGSIGLKNMLVGYNVDYVDKKFNELMKHADEKFKSGSEEIQKKIEEVFSLENKNSAVSRLYAKIEETFNENDKKSPMGKLANQLENYFDDNRGIVRKIIAENFDATNKKSPMAQFIETLNHYFDDKNGVLKKIIDGTFDVDNKTSPLGKMMNNFDFYFNDRTGVIKKQIDSTFDINNKKSVMGKFADLLDENFDLDKGKIKKLLDSNIQNSPANQMKEELLKKILEIKESLKSKETREEIIGKTALKGGVFEEEINRQLEMITQPFKDTFRYTGDISGRSGKSGDFIVSINSDDSRKIVIEAKDSSGYSKNEVEQILEKSIKNRNAKVCIFLFKSEDQIPSAFKPLKITKNRIITSYENNGLYFAYRIARLFIENELEKSEVEIPIDKIEAEIQDIQEQCKIIDTMLKKATEISNASDYIYKNLTELHTKIDTTLIKIEGYVRK